MFCMGFCDDLVNFAPCGFCFHFGWPLWGDLAATCLFPAFLVPCLFGSIVPFSFGFPNIGHQSHNLYCKCVEIVSWLLFARGCCSHDIMYKHHELYPQDWSPVQVDVGGAKSAIHFGFAPVRRQLVYATYCICKKHSFGPHSSKSNQMLARGKVNRRREVLLKMCHCTCWRKLEKLPASSSLHAGFDKRCQALPSFT